MDTSQILRHLYSLNPSSPDFSRYLYHLIQSDGEDHYLSDLQGSDLIRLVDFLDRVRVPIPASIQFAKQTSQALTIIPTADDVSRLCLHKLQTICSHHGFLPSSHIISGGLTRVGDYAFASGGFADVWEGVHGNTKVCIKCPRITVRDRQDIEKVNDLHGTPIPRLLNLTCVGTQAFYKEATVWKHLRHQNIVSFIGVTQDPLQFVSEWMPNGTLTQYLSENPGVNRVDLVSFLLAITAFLVPFYSKILDVAEGLAYLHAKHTAHGDLKGVGAYCQPPSSVSTNPY